jgi:hypothetical protein
LKTPLARPALPARVRVVPWDAPAAAVFGEQARALAEALREGLRDRGVEARLLEVSLRHTPGFALEDRGEARALQVHPDALAGGLAEARSGEVTVGVGAAFAAGVDAALRVWIEGSDPRVPAALRPATEAARLRLARADPAVARALAERWPRRT